MIFMTHKDIFNKMYNEISCRKCSLHIKTSCLYQILRHIRTYKIQSTQVCVCVCVCQQVS